MLRGFIYLKLGGLFNKICTSGYGLRMKMNEWERG